jgi:hypothetical protein
VNAICFFCQLGAICLFLPPWCECYLFFQKTWCHAICLFVNLVQVPSVFSQPGVMPSIFGQPDVNASGFFFQPSAIYHPHFTWCHTIFCECGASASYFSANLM